MGSKRRFISIIIFTGMIIALSTLGAISQSQVQLQTVGPPLIPQPGKPGGSLTFALPSAPPTLNPLFSINPVIELMQAPLVQINRLTRQIEPALATSWEFSVDNASITFHLRQGLQWSDGVPFTADDVVFSFGLYLNPNLQTILGLPASVKQQFQVEKIDDLTVKITAPGPIALDQLALIEILPEHKLGNAPIGSLQGTWTLNTPLAQFAGLGPYEISAIKTSGGILGIGAQVSEIDLVRNPNFWQVDQQGQRLPYLDQIKMLFISDSNQALALFKQGQTDFQSLATPLFSDPLGTAVQLQGAGFQLILTAPELYELFLAFNQDDPQLGPVFSDVRFRQAINLAIDRTQMINALPGKLAFPAVSFVHPLSLFYDPDHLVPGPNLAEANTLLDEMGLKDTDSDGIRDYNGQPLRFELLIRQDMPERAQIGQYLVQALKQIGIAVDLKPVPFQEWNSRISSPPHFQATLVAFGESYEDLFVGSEFRSQDSNHLYRYSDVGKKPAELSATQQQLDRLIQQLSNPFLTEQAKQQLVSQVEQVLVTDLPMIPLVRNAFTLAASTELYDLENLVANEPADQAVPRVEMLTYVWRGQ